MKKRFPLGFLAATLCSLAACLSYADDSDSSGLGEGSASAADERGAFRDGCARGTRIVLNPEAGAPSRQVLCGFVETDTTGAEVFVYQGIQYAASPEGENRWSDPLPPQWHRLRAVQYGPKCPQGSADDVATAAISEDCLYLNVWTPKITPDNDGDLPVMVFIHGGAFLLGSGGSAEGEAPGRLNLYDGKQFVATSREGGKDIVFVTMNYRLGVLGFLAAEGAGLTGNYGIKDQTKALQWVQRNISLFGGDPDNVMIFGESAGAQSTALHLSITANDHQSLFDRAVMESNYAIAYMDLAQAEGKARSFSRSVDCGETDDWAVRLQCLREIDLYDILKHQLDGSIPANLGCQGLQAIIPWNPVLDGSFITQDPIQASITKPVINGSNLTESIPFLAGWLPTGPIASNLAYRDLLDFLFGKTASSEIRLKYFMQYPLKGTEARFEQVVTDYLWTCFNRKLATVPSADVRRYHYVHHGSFAFWVDANGEVTGAVPEACAADGAVCHADELPFVFGNPANNASFEQVFDPEETDMSAALRAYWVEFARTSNPNVEGQTTWPLNADGVLEIQAPAAAITAVSDESVAEPANCAYWDQIGYTVKSEFNCE